MIEGKKIILRSIEFSDLGIIRKWNYDVNTSAFFQPRLPISEKEQEKWFDSQISSNSKKKLIIQDKSTLEAIGMIALMDIDHVNKSLEVGITIGNESFIGKGYAKDALKTILDFSFNQLNINLVYLNTFENNNNAIALFKSVGFDLIAILPQRTFCNNKFIGWAYMSIQKNNFNK